MPDYVRLLLIEVLLTLSFWLASGDFYTYSNVRVNSRQDKCYRGVRDPIRCMPSYENAAYGKPVVASSTCGQRGPERYCNAFQRPVAGNFFLKEPMQLDAAFQEECNVCDARKPELAHPTDYLNDLAKGNDTCWISEPWDVHPENVSVTVKLGKRFEITHISLHFCKQRPDSMVIYKSNDFGRTWSPFQYYSSQCERMYNKKPNARISKHNEQEALCTDAHSAAILKQDSIAFSVMEGRPSAFSFEQSPVLQDWATATDIRLVFHRLSLEKQGHYGIGDGNISEQLRNRQFYAISNFEVFGRCKCNGHASSCIHDGDGKLVCNCRHNTAGDDCQKCKEFHYDLPWRRATAEDPAECKPCSCNLHATRCRFNMELYKRSGGKSGGVCIECKHNTMGRHCHYCRQGYYRNPTKDITHIEACIPCACNSVGSINRHSCNHTTGQCRCKPGVIGRQCNMCPRGFVQNSNSDYLLRPCIRRSAYGRSKTQPKCKKCRATPKRIRLKRFCKREYVIQAQVTGRSMVDGWVKYSLAVVELYKVKAGLNVQRGESALWQTQEGLLCGCPKVRIGQRYLIMGQRNKHESHRPGLVVDRRTVMVPFKRQYYTKLARFIKRQKSGHCVNWNRRRA